MGISILRNTHNNHIKSPQAAGTFTALFVLLFHATLQQNKQLRYGPLCGALCKKGRLMLRIFAVLGFVLLYSMPSISDQWRYDKERIIQEYKFGDVKIELIRDTTKNEQYPDFILTIEKSGVLEAKYRGVAFDTIYPSKDNSLFIGFRNHGLPGTALIIFGPEGNLSRELKHSDFQPDYCKESVTLSKVWVSEDPKVEFTYDKIGADYEYIKEITFLDCHGKRVSLTKTINESYVRHVEQYNALQELIQKEGAK
ncbi:MAG: hypothetical protein K6L81_16165 [Agarilytica sp.]